MSGSENNSVYVYCKKISTPMLTYKFSTPPNTLLVSCEDTDIAQVNAVLYLE